MIYITHVRLAGELRHEHITRLRWCNPANNQNGENSREELVTWLRTPGAEAKVSDGLRSVDVGVVEANPPYLRTYADGVWTDNLLALLRF